MPDRGNEYSDEDEENEFSSTEDPYDGHDGIGLTGYEPVTNKHNEYATGSGSGKRDVLRKYRKLDRRGDANGGGVVGGGGGGGGAGAAVGGVVAHPVDSDSEFENLKEKGSRAKISRVRYIPCSSFFACLSFSVLCLHIGPVITERPTAC